MAFGSQIATAFVRIRPNMTGFKSETEAGVKSSFSGLAKVAGLALGGAAAFEFGKSSIEGAASLQKQVEAINAQFGAGAEDVKRFGENAAEAFGINARLADTTSARFGILFGNLGIGGKLASGMTIGLEKLAGSLAAIRGIDPATVLERLPLALAGNVRALKQLGIGIDQSQIKIAALKLGLISSTKDAITPAIKAQAIYALATANLPKYLIQARKHSGDLANVTRRLSAEWANAKDSLGAALLPEITKAARQFEHWLTTMQKSGALQRDFNTIAHGTGAALKAIVGGVKFVKGAFDTLSGAVGGAKTLLVTFFAILAVNKIRSIAGAIVNDLVGNGFKQLRIATAAEKAAYIEAFGTMEVATIGLSATIKSALVTTGIGALVVAIGLATGYVLTHWDQVKRYTFALGHAIVAVWQGLKTTLIGIAEVIGGSMTTALTAPLRVLVKVGGFLGGLFDKVFGTHIKSSLDRANNFIASVSTNLVKVGAKNVKDGITRGFHNASQAWADALTKNAADPKVADATKKHGKKIADDLTNSAIAAMTTTVPKVTAAVAKAMANAVAAANEKIRSSVIAAKSNLDTIGQKLAESVAKIETKLGGVGNAIAGSPNGAAFKKLKDLIAGGASDFKIAHASQELSSQLAGIGTKGAAAATKDRVRSQFKALTDEFNKGSISVTTFNKRLADLLAKNHVSYKTAGKVLGKGFADGFREQVAAIREQAAAIAAVPAKFRSVGSGASGEIRIIRPLEVMRHENARIAAAAAKQRERIAKASEKTAVASAKTAAAVATVRVGKLPTQTPGHASKRAKQIAKTGVQP